MFKAIYQNQEYLKPWYSVQEKYNFIISTCVVISEQQKSLHFKFTQTYRKHVCHTSFVWDAVNSW